MSIEGIPLVKIERNAKPETLRRLTPLLLILLFINVAHAGPILEPEGMMASIIIDEYEIRLEGEITPGKHVLPVKNIGSMLHEVVIFKLKEGVTTSDFKSVVSAGGSLRKVGKMKGNMPPIKFGNTGSVSATFDAGHYLLLCFQFDKESGQPHFMIGMLHEFTVS